MRRILFPLRRGIPRLMSQVVECANFVVVTPIVSASKPYRSSNCWKAKTVLFDEAAAMHRADGLLVYGNSIRPAVVFGNEKQLPSAPMPMGARRDDENAVNRFGQDAKTSSLSMFDTALAVTYSHLKDHFSYGPSCELSTLSYANAIRTFINGEHNLGLPPTTMSPVFVDCVECPSRKDPVSKSRYNPRATVCMIQWLEEFSNAVNFPPDKIVVITPYRAHMLSIKNKLETNSLFSKVQTATIESYQGRENEMVFRSLTVDRDTGPCFVAQPQRLNVATGRHKLFMVVFGDVQTSISQEPDKCIKAVTEEGTKMTIKPGMFHTFIEWFVKNNRAAKVEGDPTVDPDEEWGMAERGSENIL
ncbi:uncharacterized protein FIESC28_04950 [Fusarium coffeatum]|uniref:DNA2/NAM7 helicase-like C-terminal domain-containing protein n=1 Tax=Fusarium coffeatum TaxID=231269 RepID=A0A366RWF6_9HYPO|nr:uncharacterized protein FIESC28_04950 [Fusarium coffeatum]RBR21413.1 hypothetical protein FIESC28_04950 [Fusarium coffeatum]